MNRVGSLAWRLSVLVGAIRAAFGPSPRPIAYLKAREPLWQRIRHLFKPAPPPPPYRRFTPPPWFMEPESELGVAVPVREVLVSKPEVVVALVDCVAYTTGFKFSIAMRTKSDVNPAAMGFPGPYMHRPPEEPYKFGVRFADGRDTKSSTGREDRIDFYKAIQEGREPDVPVGPVLSPLGGGGGGRRWDFRYWVWPLPPEGPVTITCEWPELWSGTITADVDGTAIRRAGENSEQLW